VAGQANPQEGLPTNQNSFLHKSTKTREERVVGVIMRGGGKTGPTKRGEKGPG